MVGKATLINGGVTKRSQDMCKSCILQLSSTINCFNNPVYVSYYIMYFHLRHYPMRQCTFTSLSIFFFFFFIVTSLSIEAVLYFLFIYYLVVLDLSPDLVMSWAQSIYKRSRISPQFRFLLFSQNQNHHYHHHLSFSPLSLSPYLIFLPILI